MNFSPTRFLSLIKRDWIINKKLLALLLAAFPILVYLTCYIQNKSDHLDSGFILNWFGIYLLLGGAVFTSTVMWEFGSSPKRLQYLTIPASHLEKYLSRWVYSLIIYPMFVAIVVYIVSKLFGITWSNEDKEMQRLLFKIYYVGHAVILMFAIWFNRFVLPKTFLSIFAVSTVFAIIMTLIGMIVFPELVNKNGFGLSMNESISIEPNEWFKNFAEHTLFPTLQFVFWWVIPPFFWVVGYFKMTEKEA